jgi:antitoxin component YwqK of YwqJK toxin-antitoxin module
MKRPIEYYPNGQKRWEGGYFDNFNYTGNCYAWYESGNKLHESIDIYFDGSFYMFTAWYENGQMMSRGVKVDNMWETGLWTAWYENGNKKSEGYYKDQDERGGEWKFWHSNGKLACTGIHKGWGGDGLWVFWDEAGNKIHEREYRDDEFLSVWDNLRADGCSDELVDKYKQYIFHYAWRADRWYVSEIGR